MIIKYFKYFRPKNYTIATNLTSKKIFKISLINGFQLPS